MKLLHAVLLGLVTAKMNEEWFIDQSVDLDTLDDVSRLEDLLQEMDDPTGGAFEVPLNIACTQNGKTTIEKSEVIIDFTDWTVTTQYGTGKMAMG